MMQKHVVTVMAWFFPPISYFQPMHPFNLYDINAATSSQAAPDVLHHQHTERGSGTLAIKDVYLPQPRGLSPDEAI
jgi:hypothetical protein